MTTTTNQPTLEALDAMRIRIIDLTWIGCTDQAARLLARYEAACREVDIDPDTWEGLR